MLDETTDGQGGAEVGATADGLVGNHAEPMSENVRECPIGESICLPKPPPGTDGELQVMPAGLSPQQLTAITLLATGQPLALIAHRLNVSPRTLYRWRHDDEPFIAELERRQQDMYDVLANRLRLVAMKAMRIVDHEITRPRRKYEAVDVPMALSILRATGVMRHLNPAAERGSTTSRSTERSGQTL